MKQLLKDLQILPNKIKYKRVSFTLIRPLIRRLYNTDKIAKFDIYEADGINPKSPPFDYLYVGTVDISQEPVAWWYFTQKEFWEKTESGQIKIL